MKQRKRQKGGGGEKERNWRQIGRRRRAGEKQDGDRELGDSVELNGEQGVD